MKIGILSMQHVINYGSFLQAYALKSMIEAQGYEVRFVSIRNGRKICEEKSSAGRRRMVIDKHLLKRVEHVMFQKRRRKAFEEEFFPLIGIDQPVAEEKCDTVVIGSDEVFNCCQPSRWGFSRQLFGDICVPTISYAASCGYTTYEKAAEYGIVDELADALGNLKAISVRDNNTSDFIRQVLNKEPVQHIDPVLVFDWKNVKPAKKKFRNYILVYAYDNRIQDENEIVAIRKFAREHNKQLISFGVFQRWCDKNVMCTPFELLSYFDEADYVVTDTFHGTVISIKRNKKFATIIRDSNRNKLEDLLCRFNLQNRKVMRMDELGSVLEEHIDYVAVNEKIHEESQRTAAYLRSCLSDGSTLSAQGEVQ